MSPSRSRCSEAIDEPSSISAPVAFRCLGFTIRAFDETNNPLKEGVSRQMGTVACRSCSVEGGCIPLSSRICLGWDGL